MSISRKRTAFGIVGQSTDLLAGLILTLIVIGFLGFWLMCVHHVI